MCHSSFINNIFWADWFLLNLMEYGRVTCSLFFFESIIHRAVPYRENYLYTSNKTARACIWKIFLLGNQMTLPLMLECCAGFFIRSINRWLGTPESFIFFIRQRTHECQTLRTTTIEDDNVQFWSISNWRKM